MCLYNKIDLRELRKLKKKNEVFFCFCCDSFLPENINLAKFLDFLQFLFNNRIFTVKIEDIKIDKNYQKKTFFQDFLVLHNVQKTELRQFFNKKCEIFKFSGLQKRQKKIRKKRQKFIFCRTPSSSVPLEHSKMFTLFCPDLLSKSQKKSFFNVVLRGEKYWFCV